MKRKKRTDRAKIVDALDREVSRIIRARGRCVCCGGSQNMTNGHLFTRTDYSTRWDITEDGNCQPQCVGCNLRHEHDSYPYTAWYIAKFGLEQYHELHRRHKAVRIIKTFELEELLTTLKEVR